MKLEKLIVLSAFFIITQNATAESYLGCGAGLLSKEAPQASWLKRNNNHLLITDCWHKNEPRLSQTGFFAALPSLRWQQDIHTHHGLNHKKRQESFKSYHGDWSFWRAGEALIGITGSYYQVQQNPELSKPVMLDGQTLGAGTQLPIQQKAWQAGVLFDVRLYDSAIHQIKLTRHKQQQTLLIQEATGSDALSLVKTRHWQLTLEHEDSGFGWLWQWQFSPALGKVTDAHYPSVDKLADKDFIAIEASLGLMRRYRVTSHLHPYVQISGTGRYWWFNQLDNGLAEVASFHQLDYQATAGLSWRF